jgi:sulfopyruvate decarboxylase TPP-binding subunit
MLNDILQSLYDADIRIVTGVPDGWIVPLIDALAKDERFDYIPAAREEECFGIASGAVMAGKRAMVMVQNSGFLNAVGCYATLCQKYQTAFVVLIAHRGGINDSNSYDPNKFRAFEAVTHSMNIFTHNATWEELPAILPKAYARSEGAGEPTFVTITEAPKL